MYHYFPDKRAFFAAVVKDEADRLYESTQQRARRRPDHVRRGADGCAGLHGLPRAEPGSCLGGYRVWADPTRFLLGVEDDAKNRSWSSS